MRGLRRIESADAAPHVAARPAAAPGPVAPATAPSPSSPAFPARRNTCSQCRIRKVRCDGRHGRCRNCERLKFECSFQQIATPAQGRYVLKVPEPRRRMQACIPCHTKKTRCLGELPSCSNCIRKGRECAYPKAKKPDAGPGASDSATVASDSNGEPVTPSGDASMMEPEDGAPLAFDTMMELMEDYFRHLYPLPSFAFLHKPTVIQRCREKTINEPLKLAICALTSLQLERSTLPHDLWVQQAEQSILQHLGQPSIFHLQALLLVIRYRIENGDFPNAFMLAALAARTAVALRLNYERSELSSVAQEARRRLFWSLYLLDDFFCVGLREFELFPEETIHLLLPCDEDLFQAGECRPTGFLHPGLSDQGTVGLRGVFFRVTSARRAIMSFIRKVGLGEESASTIGESIRRFEERLSSLRDSLAPNEQYSATNLAASRWQAQYIMVHMSYHQCHCDLYRIFLSGFSEAAPPPVLASIHPRDCISMQQKCFDHAEGIIRILSDFSRTGESDCLLERDAAVCAFESARIAMFRARMAPAGSNLEVALGKANLCLDIISKFFQYSASTRLLRSDLERRINKYRHALQMRGALAEPDPSAPRSATRVSQYANSRQRLSVQSLLLQSDFVDDSDEIAGPSSGGDGGQPQLMATVLQQQQLQPQPQHTANEHGMLGIVKPGPQIWEGGANAPIVPLVPTAGHFLPGAPAMGMGNDDAGVAFNPWMGFTGNEDVYGAYGLSTGVNEEY